MEEENNFKVVALARLVDGEEKKLDKNDRIKLISKSFVISDEMFTQPDKQTIQEYEEYKTAAASASAPVSQLPSLSSSHKTAVNLAQPTASISRPSSSLSQNTILGSSISQRIPDMPALRK